MPKPTIELIGFPMDLGADRRGVDMGPSALRIAGIGDKLTALGYRVVDSGDVPIRGKERQRMGNPRLKYLPEIVRTCARLAHRVESALARGRFPLCVGGDHSMAIGTIAGIASHLRRHGRTLGVIWIDAHADINSEETTPSGNIHGMSMAVALGIGDHRLTRLLGFAPKAEAAHCAMIGLRSVDDQERETIRQRRVPAYTMSDIDRRGMDAVIREILQRLSARVDHLHVSFDLDSVDPAVAGGVGTPVAGGLSYRETHLLMETIAECGCMASLEIAEINPILDHRNESALFAADIIASSLGKRIL
jgi:arginase